MDIKKVSKAELVAELQRRKEIEDTPPVPLTNPNFNKVISMVISGVKKIAEEHYEDDDFKHYIYEEVMTAIYGKTYWPWINKIVR